MWFSYIILSLIFIGCQRGRSSRHEDMVVVAQSLPTLMVSTTTTSYSVHVGSTIDGNANAAACSYVSTSGLSSCNLRSAWALCQSLITTTTCQSTTLVSCMIVLPSTSTIQMQKAYGSNGLDLSGLSTWASSCQYTQVSLSIASPASTRPAIIVGDSSSAPLLHLQGIPFVDLTMENVTITGFGDGSNSYPGVVVLTSIQSVRFAHVQIGPKNIASWTSVILLQSLSSATIVGCNFVGNSLDFIYNLLAQNSFGSGAALQILKTNNVLISHCSFSSNNAPYGTSGGALAIISSNNIAITTTSFMNNNIWTKYGWGGAVYISFSTNISIASSHFDSNSVSGGDGSGGALYASFSSFINIVDTSFTNNSALDAGGQGGALAIYSTTNIMFHRCTFTGNSAQQGGGIILGRSTLVDMIEIFAMNNSAVQHGSDSLLQANNINGGFMAAPTDNSYVSIVKSSFFENTAATNGGAMYFGRNNTILAFTNLTFTKNVAVMGSGGAVYMESSNQHISFGGAFPAVNHGTVEEGQTTFNIVQDTLARGKFRVVGYYAVFDASLLGTCDCIVKVGTYVAGATDPNCDWKKGWDANHMPGMNGKPPYYINQTDISSISITTSNGWLNLVLAPVVVATGPHEEDIIPTLSFVGNQAGTSGGAVHLSKQHRFVFFMRGTTFINNKVTSSAGAGGAIYIGAQNDAIFLFENTFKGGQGAASGGAVAIINNNFVINFYDCVFNANTAQQGGALFINQNNGDTASKDGDQTITNGVQLSGGSIRNNNALFGGGIYMLFTNVVLLQQMEISGNVAWDRGGALFIDMGFQSLYMNTVTFHDNHADAGGGAISSDVDNVGTSNAMNLLAMQGIMIFRGNSAGTITGRSKGYGGALSVITSTLVLNADTNLIVHNNTADGGSAILLVSSSESTASVTTVGSDVSMSFVDNVCRSEGGTVYWICSSNDTISTALGPLLQPIGHNVNHSTVVWKNNQASLSQKIATQPTTLHALISSTTITLVKYGSFIRPSPSFQLVDSFGIVNSTDFTSSVIVTVTNYNCGNGRIGYLSGVQNVQVVAGVATFDSLSAFCYPGGNMTLQFTAQLSGLDLYHSLNTKVTINFRTCREGEILEINQCVSCPTGSYSFSTNQAAQCIPCPPNANGCSGAIINVSPGYWRPNVHSKIFLECPYPKGCIGGNGSSINPAASTQLRMRHLTSVDGKNDGCAMGYEGPLCGICSSDYFLNLESKECQSCRGKGPSQIATLVLVPFFLLAFAWWLVLIKNDKSYFSCFRSVAAGNQSTPNTPRPITPHLGGNDDSEETSMITRVLSSLSYDIVMPKFKIVVTSFQILSTFPHSLGTTFSTGTSSVLSSLSYFCNLLAVPGSPQCYTTRYDYVDRIMLSTISPLVICALLPLSFGVHYVYLKRRGKDFRPIVSRYVSMFLLITYTVLPSVCTTIFGAFSSCISIDPEGLLGTYSLYHPKDFSISCNSSRYYFGIVWASVMVIIYPVGIPCLYLYLLFLARAEIILGKEKQITESTSKTLKRAGDKDNLGVSNNGNTSMSGKNLDNSVSMRATLTDRSGKDRGSSERVFGNVNAITPRVSVKAVPVIELSTEAKTPSIAVKKPKDTRSKAEKLLGKVTASANSKAEKLLGTVMTAANNHAAKILSRDSMLASIVSELEFLHRDYRASHWYWEIVLTYGKLLLTAVISIIYPGSNEQIVIAWIIAFFLMRVQTMSSPYLDHHDDSLKKIADYQVLLFLFVTIIRQGNVVNGIIWGTFLDVFMIILIFLSPVAAFWYAFIEPSETVANLRKDQRNEKAKAALERQSKSLQNAVQSSNLRSRRNNNQNNQKSQRNEISDRRNEISDRGNSSRKPLLSSSNQKVSMNGIELLSFKASDSLQQSKNEIETSQRSLGGGGVGNLPEDVVTGDYLERLDEQYAQTLKRESSTLATKGNIMEFRDSLSDAESDEKSDESQFITTIQNRVESRMRLPSMDRIGILPSLNISSKIHVDDVIDIIDDHENQQSLQRSSDVEVCAVGVNLSSMV